MGELVELYISNIAYKKRLTNIILSKYDLELVIAYLTGHGMIYSIRHKNNTSTLNMAVIASHVLYGNPLHYKELRCKIIQEKIDDEVKYKFIPNEGRVRWYGDTESILKVIDIIESY